MNVRPGFLSLFGFTYKDEHWLTGFFSEKFGIVPNVIAYPDEGSFFYFTNHGEIEVTENSVFLKMGFLRSSQGNPLSNICKNLQSEFNPASVENTTISGNGYLIIVEKKNPRFAIFMTFMATTQLYYMAWYGGILFCSDLRVLLSVADRIEFNDNAIPLHYMFLMAPGPVTYFKDIYRIFPGEVLTWHENKLHLKHIRDSVITTANPEYRYKNINSMVCNDYFDQLSNIMNYYISEIERQGGKFSNEFSGGVDSSILQLLINQKLSSSGVQPTFSYNWEAESFQFEAGYAQKASVLLGTKHTFLNIQNHDYAALLVDTIETLSQPTVFAESIPGQLALARYLSSNYPEIQYMFTGQGSDVLHGINFARNVEKYKHLPGYYAIRYFYYLFGSPVYRKKIKGLPDVFRILFMPDTCNRLHPPRNMLDPFSQVNVGITRLNACRYFFGDRIITDALDYRYELSKKVITSHSILEQVQDIDAITGGYEPATVFETLLSSLKISLIPFYFDQEVIRLIRSFSPEVRFLHNKEVKPVLKTILAQKSLHQIAYQKKGGSCFPGDFEKWMTRGVLKEMAHSIERPDFIRKKDFDNLLEGKLAWVYEILWPMLTYDIFKKHISKQYIAAARI